MKHADFKDKSLPRGFGKGLTIVIVIVFSSLSFVLGYFVGKIGRQEPAAVSPVRAAETPAPGVQPPAPVEAEASQNRGGALPDSPPLPALPGQEKTASVAPEGPDKSAVKHSVLPKTDEGPLARKKETPKEENAIGETSTRETVEVYTVQLGALRKATEARKLRTKFRKKGYKTFLVTARNKKHETIYKVRVGEFRLKRDAEVLALKLRKTEGLNAFVTVKN
jgi:cell division septation protein DedD